MTNRISLIVCSLLLSTTAPGVGAASRFNKHNGKEQERRVRGSLSASTTNKGPRGSSRRHLQDDMGAPLSSGFGGQGGVYRDQESLPMRDQIIPVTPTVTPVAPDTPPPTIDGRNVTYLPGMLTVMERDLILSQGLTSRIIALSGVPVLYADGTTSVDDFHPWPDGAATFIDNRPGNEGGWLYLSNVEDKKGGVGALTFDKDGNVLKYEMLLTTTTYNCNGGRTPWGYVIFLAASNRVLRAPCMICYPSIFWFLTLISSSLPGRGLQPRRILRRPKEGLGK